MNDFIDPLETEEPTYSELFNAAGQKLGGIDPAGNRTDQALRSAVFSDEAERLGTIKPQYHGIIDTMADSLKATSARTAAGFAKSFGADQYAQRLERIVQDHPEWQQSEQQGLAGWLAYNGVSGLVTTAPTILAGLAMPASAPLWAIRALQGTVTGAQLFGDNFEKALELSNGKMSPYAALGIATLNTTVQAGIEMSLGPQRWLTDSLRRAMTRQLTKDAVEKIGIMATSKLMPRVGKMLVAGFEEGNEELLQLGSDDIASKFLSKGASEMSKAGDYIQNFLAGAWGGIVLGAPANIVEHVVKNRVAKDINALAKAPTPEQQAAIADRYLPGAVRADPMLLDEARRQFMAQEDAAFATLEGQIEDPAMKPVVPVMHNIAYQMSAMDGGRARPSQYIETLKTVFLDESKLDPGDLEQMRKEMAATSDETQRFNVMRRYFPKFDLAVQSVQKAREISRLTEMRDMLGRSNRDKAPLPQMDKQTSGQFIDMLSALAQKAMGETEAGSATIDRSTLFGWLDSGELNTESLRHIILSGGIDGIKIGSKTYRMKLNSDLSLSVVESVAAAEDRAADPTPILTMLKKGDADGLRASNQDIEITKLKIAITEVARQREMLDLLDAMDGVNTTEERLQKLADLRHASAKIDGLNAQIAQMRAEQEAGKATEAPEVQKERARQITSFEQMAKELEQFRKPVALLPERATQARQMPDLDRMTYMELQEAARQAGMKDWEGFSQPELKAKLLTRYTAINQIGDGFTPEQLDAMDEITLRQVAAISGMEPEDLTPAQIKVRLLSAFPRQSTPLMEKGEKRASRLTDDQRKAWDITGTYLRDSRLAVFYADADMETIIHEWFHHLSTSGLLPEGMSKHLMRRWGVNAKGQTIADIRRQYEKAGQPPPSEEELMNGIRWTNTSEENAVREFLAYIRDARIDDPQTKAIFDAVRDTFSRVYYRVSDEYTKEGIMAERRITPEQDAAYAALAAKAESGDKQAEAEAQRMVDEAAKAAGYYGGQPDSVRQAWQERSRQLDVAIDIAKSNIERSEAAIPRHDPSTTIGKIARKSLERNREQLRSLTAERDAGQPVSPLYHGSSHEWTVYRRKAGGRSIWTSDNAEVAGTYGDRTTPLYMMMNRPMVFDAQGASYRDLMFEGKRLDADDLAQIAEERGHDGLIIRNFYDSNTDDGGSVIADHYTTFTPEHIKSADPFTYEEQADGTKKLVDLSRRFNSEEDSILLERRPVGVAAEFVFGTDAPLWNEYPGFMQASAEAKSEVTRRAAEAIQPILKSEFGEDMLTHSFGEGGWMKGVSPNVVTSFKTKDVAIRAADAIGAAWQQDGMMVANADEAGTDSMMVFGKVDVSDLTMEERRAVYPLIEEILFPAMQAANPDAVIGFTQINRGVDTPEQMMIAMPFSSKEQTSALLESVWSKIEASVKEKLNIDLDRATESGTVVFRSKGSDYTWKEGNADDRTKSSTENGVRSFAGRIQDATRTVLDQAKREQLFEREERAQAGTQAGTQARETIGFNPEADAAMGQLLKPVAGETLGAIMGDGLYGDLRYRSTFESRVPSPGEVEQAAQAAAQAGEGGVLMDRRSPADRQNRNGQPLLERRNPLYSKDQAQERTRAEVNRQLHAVFYNADDKEMTHQKASDFVKEFIRTKSGRTITSLTEATDDELKAATEDAASKFGRGKAYFSDRLVQQFFGTHMTAEEYKAYNPEAFAWMTDRLMDEIGIPAMGTRIANMGAEASALADVQDKLHSMRPVRPNVASGNSLVTETKNALKRLLQAGIKYTHGLYDMCKALDDSNEGVMKSSASFTKLVWARFRDANHAIARKYLPVEQEYADRVKNGDFFKNAFEVFTLSNGEKYSYNEMLVIYSLANGQRVSSGTLETTDKSGKKKLKQEYRDLAAWLYGNIGTDDASVSKGIATANAIVDRINGDATLKRQALAEIGWQNDIGLKFFETAAKVYKDWSGRDARPLKGMYTPIVRLSSDIKEGDLEGIWESMDGREFEFLNLDALKEFHRRSGGRGGEIKLDYRGNFLRHIEAMSNYTEKRALVEETLAMLGNTSLRDSLRRRFGTDDIVLSGLEKAIRREMKPSGLHSDDNMGGSILGKIQRNFYASVFPWNVFTVPTQLTSLSNGWAEAGLSPTVVGQSMKYLGNIAAHVTKNMSRFKSGQVSHILSGLDMYEEAKRLVPSLMRRFPIAEADTYRRNQSFLSRHLKGYDKMIEEGQLFMELGDMGAVLPTWKALFEENKNRMAIEHKDWNASRIEQEAANAAYDAVVQSQNPSTQTEKSLWQTGSPMAKAMIPFSGQTFVLLHNLINDVALPLHNAIQEKGLARGVKDVVLRKQFLAKYAGRFVIPAILMGMIARRRPPENWAEVAKDFAVYPFTTVPVIGNMIWASMFLGWKDGGPVSFYETLAKDATDLIKNAAALQWDQKDTEKLTRTAGLAVGFPQAIIRILNTTIDNAVHENKNWDGESLKKALGFKTKG